MARGDVTIGSITSVPSGSSLTFQPAAGVTCLVLFTGSSAAGVINRWYDGTNICALFGNNATYATQGGLFPKFLINNSVYLAIYNGSGGTQNLCYGVVEV